MMRKFVLAAAVALAAAPAAPRHPWPGGGGGHGGGGHWPAATAAAASAPAAYTRGGVYRGGVYRGGVYRGGLAFTAAAGGYGGGGRYWGGRWWAYGVGPCWRLIRSSATGSGSAIELNSTLSRSDRNEKAPFRSDGAFSICSAAIFRPAHRRFEHLHRVELRQVRLDAVENPDRDIFRGRIFQPLDLVEQVMVEPLQQRLEGAFSHRRNRR